MLALWQQYFDFLIHPFYSHALLRRGREEASEHPSNVHSLFEDQSQLEAEEKNQAPDFLAFMGMSWPFYIMQASYTIVGVYLTGKVITSEFRSEGLMDLFDMGYSFNWEKVILFSTILWVVFFPLVSWVAMKFWSLLLTFFSRLFQVEEEHLGEVCDEVARSSLVSHFFLVIPILGELLKQISSWIYLYAGCRANLGLTRLQSFIVIVSPLILSATLILFMVIYLGIIVSVLL